MPDRFDRDPDRQEQDYPLSTDAAWIRELIQRTAVLETSFSADQATLNRQALEYERRLTELNHAHNQILQERGAMVTRDQFDSRNREVDRAVSDLIVWKSKVIGYAMGAGAASGVIVGLLTKLVTK